MKKKLIIGILILVCAAVAIVVYKKFFSFRILVPESVDAQYKNLNAKNKFAGYMARCLKDGSTVYVVNASTGITAKEYFFDEQGNDLGWRRWSDELIFNNPDPTLKRPINMVGYKCQTIRAWGLNTSNFKVYEITSDL